MSRRRWNQKVSSGVIICGMRRHGPWLNLVALLALIVGSVPVSAFASLFAGTTCNMPCCAGKPAHVMDGPECVKGCEDAADTHTGVGHHEEAEHGVRHESGDHHLHGRNIGGLGHSEPASDSCKCTIRSGPSTPDQPVAVSTSHQLPFSVDGLLPQAVSVKAPVSIACASPGIRGTDSGPPESRPNYAFLGRAPPVLLA